MIIEVTDKEGKSIGKQRIVIPTFDFYSKEVGDWTKTKRVTIFTYKKELRVLNLQWYKTLLCKISSESTNNEKNIPYGLNILTNKIYTWNCNSTKRVSKWRKNCHSLWHYTTWQTTSCRHSRQITIFNKKETDKKNSNRM